MRSSFIDTLKEVAVVAGKQREEVTVTRSNIKAHRARSMTIVPPMHDGSGAKQGGGRGQPRHGSDRRDAAGSSASGAHHDGDRAWAGDGLTHAHDRPGGVGLYRADGQSNEGFAITSGPTELRGTYTEYGTDEDGKKKYRNESTGGATMHVTVAGKWQVNGSGVGACASPPPPPSILVSSLRLLHDRAAFWGMCLTFRV